MVEDDNAQEAVLRMGKVDTIISEPIGVMLLHERMVGQALILGELS
jgi:histone-arginine methyltransferase CARM1